MFLHYDINIFYTDFTNTFLSLWPIVGAAIAITMAGLMIGGIIKIFYDFHGK